MATNEILPFAEDDTGTNLLTQAEYSADAQRLIGNQPGVARSKLVNKVLRQASLIAASLAKFVADNQTNNIVDTASVSNIASWMEKAVRSIGVPTASSGGTADALTADFTPNADTWLSNGSTLVVRASLANLTTTPTLAADGVTAKTIVKGSNKALVAGDIAGAGHWLVLQFDSTLDKYVLLNPATGVSTVTIGNDPTIADNSSNPASTSWIRNAMTTLAAAAGFTYFFGANGYIKFPTWFAGWVVQWGTVTTNGSGLATITFPLTFPTQPLGISLQDLGSAVANIDVFCSTLISTSQCSVACATNAGVAQAATAYYIAWGN